MAKRKSFLLRIDPKLYAALERWAADELRSVNGQIEFLLREALKRAGRLKSGAGEDVGAGEMDDDAPDDQGVGEDDRAGKRGAERAGGP